MANPTEHALEHGEHAVHAAHDPFDRQVTMTIAITAALLACATMLGHRAHNETLELHIRANDDLTEGSNKFNHYQAKKDRQTQYETALRYQRLALKDPRLSKEQAEQWRSATEKDTTFWTKDVARYEDEIKELRQDGDKLMDNSKHLKEKADHVHHIGTRYDFAELGVELGLVFCSLAVLTKKRSFWYSGMGCSAIGTALMLWGVAQQFVFVAHH